MSISSARRAAGRSLLAPQGSLTKIALVTGIAKGLEAHVSAFWETMIVKPIEPIIRLVNAVMVRIRFMLFFLF
jgi:hypothetical protein